MGVSFLASLPKLHQDIATNYVWLHPIVSSFPETVPGTILMTDVWLYLDRLLGGKLFVAQDVPKQNQAATEAGRCKKLIGALRYLYRNSISVFARHGFWLLPEITGAHGLIFDHTSIFPNLSFHRFSQSA